MNRKTIIILLSICIVCFVNQSCKKSIKGCTDSKSINYSPSATESDGSCLYKGNVIFWKDDTDNIGDIIVTMADSTKGLVNLGESVTPACNASGCFTYSANPGTYAYRATNSNGLKWSGSVTITSEGCTSKELTFANETLSNVDFTIDLTDPKYSLLSSIGGFVYVNGIIIFKDVTNNYDALSAYCTYDGSVVSYQTAYNRIVCPGDGSQFDINGNPTFGQATKNLAKYKTQLNGNLLRVY